MQIDEGFCFEPPRPPIGNEFRRMQIQESKLMNLSQIKTDFYKTAKLRDRRNYHLPV